LNEVCKLLGVHELGRLEQCCRSFRSRTTAAWELNAKALGLLDDAIEQNPRKAVVTRVAAARKLAYNMLQEAELHYWSEQPLVTEFARKQGLKWSITPPALAPISCSPTCRFPATLENEDCFAHPDRFYFFLLLKYEGMVWYAGQVRWTGKESASGVFHVPRPSPFNMPVYFLSFEVDIPKLLDHKLPLPPVTPAATECEREVRMVLTCAPKVGPLYPKLIVATRLSEPGNPFIPDAPTEWEMESMPIEMHVQGRTKGYFASSMKSEHSSIRCIEVRRYGITWL
jgi:hypothetical protein